MTLFESGRLARAYEFTKKMYAAGGIRQGLKCYAAFVVDTRIASTGAIPKPEPFATRIELFSCSCGHQEGAHGIFCGLVMCQDCLGQPEGSVYVTRSGRMMIGSHLSGSPAIPMSLIPPKWKRFSATSLMVGLLATNVGLSLLDILIPPSPGVLRAMNAWLMPSISLTDLGAPWFLTAVYQLMYLGTAGYLSLLLLRAGRKRRR